MKDQLFDKFFGLYISYLPVLTRIVDLTDGPILELGMGFSTMILDMMCCLTKRPLVSYENDRKWYEKSLVYASDFHQILLAEDWDKIDIDSTHWSVAFIDHRPALRRRVEAKRLKDNADYIILHDSEPEINKFYRYTDIYPLFKYRYDYTRCKPYTVVLSNFKKLNL